MMNMFDNHNIVWWNKVEWWRQSLTNLCLFFILNDMDIRNFHCRWYQDWYSSSDLKSLHSLDQFLHNQSSIHHRLVSTFKSNLKSRFSANVIHTVIRIWLFVFNISTLFFPLCCWIYYSASLPRSFIHSSYCQLPTVQNYVRFNCGAQSVLRTAFSTSQVQVNAISIC